MTNETLVDAHQKVVNMLKYAKAYEILKKTNAIVAGGCFLSVIEERAVNDIDIFFSNLESAEEAIRDLRIELKTGYTIEYDNKTATMLEINGLKINFIKKRFFDNIQDLFDDFDFTCTMIGFEVADGMLRIGEGFRESVDNKKLMFNHKNNYPITSLPRVTKYMSRGYTISDAEITLIGLAIANLRIETTEALCEQAGTFYKGISESKDYSGMLLPDAMEAYRRDNPFVY